jgi:hypothetical protein
MRYLTVGFVLFWACLTTAQADYQQALSSYNQLLQQTVNKGKVDYALMKNKVSELDIYIDAVKNISQDGWQKNQKMALYINAYNAFTLKLIIEYWPDIKSIKDIPDNFFAGYKRWDAKRWNVSGKVLSLNDIEHKILRPMGDARIHFTIVCASISCPDLANYAYDVDSLDAQLHDAAVNFLADDDKGFAFQSSSVTISKIFAWFEEDFERDKGDVISFILPFVSDSAKTFIAQNRKGLEVEYFDYDWNLNK